jgi:hypothetical protein
MYSGKNNLILDTNPVELMKRSISLPSRGKKTILATACLKRDDYISVD